MHLLDPAGVVMRWIAVRSLPVLLGQMAPPCGGVIAHLG
jgi:hypothetical protein